METENFLKGYSNPKVHSEIVKLTEEQKVRVKNLIKEIAEKADRDFEISELQVLSDRIEIAATYKLTMF